MLRNLLWQAVFGIPLVALAALIAALMKHT